MRLEDPIGRRELLGNAVKGGVVLLTAGATGTAVGLFTPERRTGKEEGFDLYHGCFEDRTGAKFIDPNNRGHFPFLREAILNNPRLSDLTKDYYTYLEDNLRRKQRISLGDAFNFAVTSADKKLKDIDPAKIKPGTNPLLESLHAGLFAFAAGFMPWFSTADLKQIGVNLKSYEHSSTFFQALGEYVYPRLFTREDIKEDPTDLESGQDRSIHFAQHQLLTFEYLYSKRFELGLEKSVPLVLQSYVFLMSLGSSTAMEAKAFSQGIGLGWEYFGLRNIENWPIFGRKIEDIREGPFEAMVGADYKGNELGASEGINLFYLAIAGEPLEAITSSIEKLNDPKFHRFETNPEL